MDGDKPLPLTEFDRVTVSESTQMIKAVVPFLDTSTKKTISIFIRFQELMQTIDFFKKPLHAESTTSFNRSNYTMKDILYETMPYFPKSTEDTLNTFQSFMEMFNVINMYKDMDQSQDFQSIINMVKNMNDPNISDAFNNMGMPAGSEFSKDDNKTKDNSNENVESIKNDESSKNGDSSKHTNNNSTMKDNLNNITNNTNHSNDNNNKNSYNNSTMKDNFNNKGNYNKKSNDNNNRNVRNDVNSNLNNNNEAASSLNNMMSAEQKKLYDKYLSEIETINFDNYKSNDIIN